MLNTQGSVQTSEERAETIAFFLSVLKRHSHLESSIELDLLEALERKVHHFVRTMKQPTPKPACRDCGAIAFRPGVKRTDICEECEAVRDRVAEKLAKHEITQKEFTRINKLISTRQPKAAVKLYKLEPITQKTK